MGVPWMGGDTGLHDGSMDCCWPWEYSRPGFRIAWVHPGSEETPRCRTRPLTGSSEEDQRCKHTKRAFSGSHILHHVWQVVLKRIHGANTGKIKVHFLEAISLHHESQVVLKNIHGANTQKSALSGSHIPALCVTSSYEEYPWWKHTKKCTFGKPNPCTMCGKYF